MKGEGVARGIGDGCRQRAEGRRRKLHLLCAESILAVLGVVFLEAQGLYGEQEFDTNCVIACVTSAAAELGNADLGGGRIYVQVLRLDPSGGSKTLIAGRGTANHSAAKPQQVQIVGATLFLITS